MSKEKLSAHKTIQTAMQDHGAHRHLLVLAVIFVLSLIAYWPTFSNGFQMEWDDQWMVFNPMTQTPFSWQFVLHVLKTPFNGQWAPLNQLLYTFLFNMFGFNATAFHIASFLFHLCNIVLVYVLLRRVLLDCTSLNPNRLEWMSAISTLLFAIHPLQVESVAWISASKFPLFAFFYLLAAWVFVRYLKKGGILRYLLTCVLFVLSYMCKEHALSFPLLATLLSVCYRKDYRKGSFWLMIGPLYVLALLMGMHELFYVAGYDDYVSHGSYAWWQRVVFCFYSISTYFFKWIVPTRLSYLYNFPVPVGEPLPMAMIFYPVLLCILVFSLWERIKANRVVLACIVFFLIHLVFVLHIFVLPRAAIIADRYMYLPIIGLNVIFAYLVTSPKLVRRYRKVVTATVVAVVLVLTGLSHVRTGAWVDSDTLKREWMKVNGLEKNESISYMYNNQNLSRQ